MRRVRENQVRRSEPAPVSSHYVMTPPSAQNAVDIFSGEWSSQLPVDGLVSGQVPLFSDKRLIWFIEEIGGVEGKSALELGPLEGGHSYLLERQGVGSVTAVEANRRAYMKCLITKEVLGLKKVRFLLGDFMAYLEQTDAVFDVCIASGVLYHMTEPVVLLERIARRAKAVFLWTHYWDVSRKPGQRVVRATHAGFDHELYEHAYGPALDWQGFCGGSQSYARWLSREGILSALAHFGYDDVRTAFEQPDHPNGPAFAVAARRRDV